MPLPFASFQTPPPAPPQAWVHTPPPPPCTASPPPVSLALAPQPPAPPPPQAQPTAAPPYGSSRQPEQSMHKNRLQEFTHKSNIPLPIYQTINEGYQHLPQFRSTVLVNGARYTSPDTFSTRKAAEQSVAELALKSISKETVVDEGFPLIHEDTVFCKSILNEFATKMNMELPTYNTIKPEGLIPVFKSSLVFNGASYTGNVGKNKKEAEQLAARVAILSLLGDSGMKKVLYDIVKSKVKLYAALHKVDSRDNTHSSTVPLMRNTVQCSGVVPSKDTGDEFALPVVSAPTTTDSVVQTTVINAATSAPTTTDSVVPTTVINAATSAIPDLNSGTVPLPPRHEFKTQKPGTSFEAINILASQATNLPIEFVHPISAHSVDAVPSSSRKRRKNKKKANKKLCTGAQLQMAALPLNQVPPCSVAQ
ncbi:Double-stranded RNA-binding domain containing protein [Parasponia andersonii]|uniref:Double-stranded RNA-binding domain containing protein n=1 Tax=Parasponia andersonii TaxID=3476 RepID=A0A2P5DVV8_PARAD|nr:Double-stranded RNA-binding domain containing protein [Parasponia andersonii]